MKTKGNIVCMAVLLLLLGACTSVSKIGEVNMISHRNISSTFDYQNITTYSGGSKRQLKKSRAETIEQAVDKTVKEVPGGEFIMNAKLYLVKHKRMVGSDYYFAVEGDVWGYPVTEGNYQGYKIGDKVMWRGTLGKYMHGTIVAIKDSETCIVEDERGSKHSIRYDKLLRTSQETLQNAE